MTMEDNNAEISASATTDPRSAETGFDTFGLSELVYAGVVAAGYKTPTPIQSAAIPVVLGGKDLIAQARTGTGKTAAFGLPAMSRLTGSPEILVITPTRELAMQVSDELFRLGKIAKVRSVAVYGGQSSGRQVELIRRGAQIVVATPGRLLDLLESKRMGTFEPSTVILDEADEMLDMGFMDDIKAIFKHLPAERQTLMFSATMPPPIRKLAQDILKQPVTINLVQQEATNTDVEQSFYIIEESERLDAVVRIIDAEEPAKSILFCRTKRETDELCEVLIARGCQARALHGDIEQGMRQDIVRAFKDGRLEMLVATDVAARGLDVTGVSHVFNYHMPFDQQGYVHRIGRTGRAGQKGKAITLVNPFEFRALKRLQQAIKASFIHREVPTAADIHNKEDAKLIRKLGLMPVSDGAVEMLSKLEEQFDLTQIACKLITMMLKKRTVRGPEKIGVSGNKLKTILGGGSGGGGGQLRGDRRSPRPPGNFHGKNFQGKKFGDRRGKR
jgi:ATP-dependent RNA helicase DeaD